MFKVLLGYVVYSGVEGLVFVTGVVIGVRSLVGIIETTVVVSEVGAIIGASNIVLSW